MATDGRLSDLVDELRAGGEVDSRGRFTLDRAQARAKMQKFQLADARRYVLELVQAAVLRGATTIAFDIDADDMRMRFDGRPFTPAELDDLWGSIFADGDGADLRGVRQLALGLNAALGLDPKRIVVRSGSQQLRLVPGRDDALTAIDPPIAETTIHVEKRLRPGLIVAFFRDLRGSLGEEVYLRERCRYARIAISLDGKSIAGGPQVEHALVSEALAEPGVAGVMALVRGQAPAEIRLVKDGVWIDTHPLAGCGPGLVAIVEAEALRKDVSMAKIVADVGFEQVAGLVRAGRWSLFARMIAASKSGQLKTELVMPWVRQEALKFMKLRDLRKRPEAVMVAEAITWMDARTCPGGQAGLVTLAALAAAVRTRVDNNARELHYATATYPALVAEGEPVARISRHEAGEVARVLSCNLVAIDEVLALAQRREEARLAWRERGLTPRLPDSRRYLFRAPIEGPQVRGEVGIAAEAVEVIARETGKLWLIREGCLLRQLDVEWGVAGIELAVAADFEPTQMFDDAIRDRVLVEVVLRALAALPGPLADLAERTEGSIVEGNVRGLIKAWLLLVLDAEELAGLWQRLAVPEKLRPGAAEVEEWLPTAAQLRAGEGPLAKLLHVRLFEDFDGTRRSLDELAQRKARVGRIDEIERGVAPCPELGKDVAWLGRGDRKIVAALLGEAALRSWAPVLQLQLRERRFRALPQRSMAEAVTEAERQASRAGLDPAVWCQSQTAGGVESVLTLLPPNRGTTAAKGAAASIELRVEGRTLTTRSMELGFGPIVGVATATVLRPNADWDDVAEDEGLAAVKAALTGAAWSLAMGVVRAWVAGREIDDATWTWLRAQLMRRLSEWTRSKVLRAAPELVDVPLFATLGERVLSLAEIEAVVAAEGSIGWVPMTCPGVTLPEPPIVREEPTAIAALRQWVGEARVVDGAERVRSQQLQRRLADLPLVTSLTLAPASVWAKLSLGDEKSKVEGEVGLGRGDGAPVLRMDVCMDGRKVGALVHEDMLAPLVAIVFDPALTLIPTGEVDARSKRYGQLLRRCRRAVGELVEQLCDRYDSLADDERAPARALLLDYAGRRIERAKKEGSEPGRGVEAVRGLPLFVDVWGATHTLADIDEHADAVVEVVTQAFEAPPGPAPRKRLIVVADPPARRSLAAIRELQVLDDRWPAELEAMRALLAAPECTLPDLREVAWVDAKAMIAGGLQAHLWIPRQPSEADTVALSRGGRLAGRVTALAALPCAGIVGVDGMAGTALDGRQRTSLAKQVCRLYETLAKQTKSGGRLGASERDAAAVWLAHVDERLAGSDDPRLEELGKPLTELKTALAGLVPPALRQARASAAQAEARKREAAETAAEAQPRAEEPAPAVPTPAPPAAPRAPVPEATPEQKLLALVRAELEWARTRHGSALEQLRLDRLAIGTGSEPGIARFDKGIVLQARHSLVARALTRLAIGEAPDPVDMVFVMANVYTVMNEVAEEIGAHDEQAFVARLAEGLAAGLAGA